MANRLSGLDGAFEEFEKGLGERWKDTTVIAITEFGRTARINGTNGSDHGTGTVAFLAGGAVAGGRVVANWPGLKANQLYQGRDLAPTTDLRAILKGVLADQLGISAQALGEKGVPGVAWRGADAGIGPSLSAETKQERSNMRIQPYLFFEGRADEAIAFYEKTLGAKLVMRVRFRTIPTARRQIPPSPTT